MGINPSGMFVNIKEYADAIFKRAICREVSTQAEGISSKASTVKRYFYGFPHIISWECGVKYDYQNIRSLSKSVNDWCRENNIEYATGIHQVILGNSYSDKEEWVINDIVGEERWFWAFKNEQDAILFALRW